jgi:hypothetical protein
MIAALQLQAGFDLNRFPTLPGNGWSGGNLQNVILRRERQREQTE